MGPAVELEYASPIIDQLCNKMNRVASAPAWAIDATLPIHNSNAEVLELDGTFVTLTIIKNQNNGTPDATLTIITMYAEV